MRTITLAVLAALVGFAALAMVSALADEPIIKLKDGPGLDQVVGNCGACHSLVYIQMNSPFLNAAGWNAEVTKMIKAYGAPISDGDAKAIANYLAKNYGT